MAKILIIDDDELFCDMLSWGVRYLGHDVQCAYSLVSGLKEATSKLFDVVLLDVHMPDGNGLEIIPEILEMDAAPEVIIMTGAGAPDGAELAMKSGVWHYIQKTSSLQAMVLPLERALLYREQKQTVQTTVALDREGIIGDSPSMKKCFDLLAQAANSEANILITGETGTGKELFAAAIHRNSSRKMNRFIVIDCAALPNTLVESTLFGHKKGAFTSADKDQDGLILQADGGTLFLDEVSEISPDLQRAFLRVLQERRFRPVGSRQDVLSNFRLVAATNRELDKMVKEGTFRQDLLYRLRSFEIHLPPLRERREDVMEIAVKHITMLCEKDGIAIKGFSPDFITTLNNWHWPGNVRELLQTMNRVFAVARKEPTLFPVHLPTYLRAEIARSTIYNKVPSRVSRNPKGMTTSSLQRLQEVRDARISEIEHSYLQDLIDNTGGDMKEACRISGVSLSRLYALFKKYDIAKNI